MALTEEEFCKNCRAIDVIFRKENRQDAYKKAKSLIDELHHYNHIDDSDCARLESYAYTLYMR